MIRFPGKDKKQISAETLVRLVWVSSFLAMIFALPGLAVFLGIYHTTGNIAVGAGIGFGIHFATLAFAGRISKFLTQAMS